MGLILMEKFLLKENVLPANLYHTVEYSQLEILHFEKCQTWPSSSAYVELFIDSSGTESFN